MPKKRDPTLMENLQREDVRESQLRSSTHNNVSAKSGLKRGLKRLKKPAGMGKRGLPY